MGKKIKFAKEDENFIINEYCNNMETIKNLSIKFHCSENTIRRMLLKNSIQFPKYSPMNYLYWVSRGMTMEDAKLKVNQIRPTSLEYFENLGYSKEEAKIKLDDVRMFSKNSFIRKYGKENGEILWNKKRKENTNITKHSLTNCIEYWQDKGYSNEEAKLKVSESQNKFSHKGCIEKYGEDKGTIVWENRQIKWQKSLKENPNINILNKKKDCKSINFFKRKYGDKWIDFLLNERGYFDNSIEYMKNCIINCATYEELIEYISQNYEYIDSYNFQNRLCRKIFCEIYKISFAKLRFDLLKKYEINDKCVFGYKRELNNVVYSSGGEFYIAQLIIENEIEFIYNKKYPFTGNSKAYRFDFYLPKYDYYIEYTGMLINSNINKDKIINKYYINIKNKILLCEQHKYNLFVSSDYLTIINFIKKIKNDEKN